MPIGTDSMMDNRERLQELVYVTEVHLEIVCKDVQVTPTDLCEQAARSINSVKMRFSLD